MAVCDEVLQARSGAVIASMLPLAPEWTATTTSDGCRIDSPNRQLEILIMQGRLVDSTRGEYPCRFGWVGRGFGRGEGRVSLVIAPGESGRVLYAIAAPEVRVGEKAGALTVQAGEDHRQLALAELLP